MRDLPLGADATGRAPRFGRYLTRAWPAQRADAVGTGRCSVHGKATIVLPSPRRHDEAHPRWSADRSAIASVRSTGPTIRYSRYDVNLLL